MTKPIEVFKLEGGEYEMGKQQGTHFRLQIRQLYDALTSSEEFLASKPFLIPKFLYRKLANLVLSKKIKEPIKEYFPSQWAFLEGLSDGSGLAMSKILFLQAIDAIGTQISNYTVGENAVPSLNNCSAVGIAAKKSSTSGVLMIKNWDGPEFLGEFTIFRKLVPSEDNKFSTIGSGVSGLIGINNGINEKGLSIVYNYAYPKNIGDKGASAMILIRGALETCSTVEETVSYLKKYPRLGGANIMVADLNGDLAVLEVGPDRIEVRRQGDDGEKSYLICTNHYLTSEMRELEIPRNAVYTENAAASFQGKSVHKTSILRYKNALEILKNQAPHQISLNFLNKEIQSSHGPDNEPSEFTFCNHGEEISTGFGVMIDVKNKEFYATLEKPCEGTMQNLTKN
ncbi:MAG: hypothetical protein GF383_07430 [Candidatus Lokiarchaeota archaeon]|nr:hypothetical protein [Candidatus Lokiarchaeota archaeon]MBD3340020.1 hypothetical protein [Candidatus Lokiarchaeota archaeon]